MPHLSENRHGPYRRILILGLSACPGPAQLQLGRELSERDHSLVQVIQYVDCSATFAPDGPAGALAAIDHRKLEAARRRLNMQLARHRLNGAHATLQCGDAGELLIATLGHWKPDLLIIPAATGVEDSLRKSVQAAGLVLPEVLTARRRPSRAGQKLGGYLRSLFRDLADLARSESGEFLPYDEKLARIGGTDAPRSAGGMRRQERVTKEMSGAANDLYFQGDTTHLAPERPAGKARGRG